MPRKRKGRIYWKRGRAYGDFRDIGGGLEALRDEGEPYATQDADRASELAEARRKELEEGKEVARGMTLGKASELHLVKKKEEGEVTDRWLVQAEQKLTAACDHFGSDRLIRSIQPNDVISWEMALRSVKNGRGGTISEATRRHYLNCLSNLFRRAQEQGWAPMGFNPVAAVMVKPSQKRKTEARWLETHEAALFLESARTYQPQWISDPHHGGGLSSHANPHVYPLVATLLLTGGRWSEVRGLAVDDVSFRRKRITFRSQPWRRLKTKTSLRTIPLWPQLEAILREYMADQERAGGLGTLLFPAHRGDGENMVVDMRKALDAIGERAGWKAGEIRTKMFRHTYCSSRLQTYSLVKTGEGADGKPVLSAVGVSEFTVAREMGHGGTSMVEEIYGHVGSLPHRSELVEFKVENHWEELGDRLESLRLT